MVFFYSILLFTLITVFIFTTCFTCTLAWNQPKDGLVQSAEYLGFGETDGPIRDITICRPSSVLYHIGLIDNCACSAAFRRVHRNLTFMN